MNRRLRDALGGRRAGAAVLLTLGFIVLLLGPALAVSVTFANQATALFKQLQATAGRYEIARPSDLLRIPFVHQFLQWAETVTPVSAEQVQEWLMSAATGLLQVAVAMSGVFVVEALGTLVSLVIMLFLLFFFLRDGEAMLDTALHLVPLDAERQGHLLLHLSAVTRAVVFGSLITAVVQGTLVGVAFALIGLPSPVVFGVLAMLAALVPLFGTALIWVPAAGRARRAAALGRRDLHGRVGGRRRLGIGQRRAAAVHLRPRPDLDLAGLPRARGRAQRLRTHRHGAGPGDRRAGAGARALRGGVAPARGDHGG